MRTPFRFLVCGLVLLGAGLAAAQPGGGSPKLVSLERQLVRDAPKVLQYLKSRGYQNVGVLKFQVAPGQKQKFSDSVGTLNQQLARRVQIALLLANDATNPLGILADPVPVVAKIRDASYLSPTGRGKLLQANYPLAWGKQQVQPDAFVTGWARISDDRKTMKVTLQVFGRKDANLVDVCQLDATTHMGLLGEMGESFSRASLVPFLRPDREPPAQQLESSGQQTAAVAAVQVAQDPERLHPLNDLSSPVQLKVLYDGRPARPRFEDGKAMLEGPSPQTKAVSIVLTLNKNAPSGRYAAVVKVNGENTLYQETKADVVCAGWLLTRGNERVEITGYQGVGDKYHLPFKVLSTEESSTEERYFGDKAGLITLSVYRELEAEKKLAKNLQDEDRDTTTVAQGALPAGQFDNSRVLRSECRERANGSSQTRNCLLVPGPAEKGAPRNLDIRTWTRDPSPVVQLAVFYYKKQLP